MEKSYIRIDCYSSMDWNDWKSYWRFLGKPENAYVIEKSDFLKLCLQDINTKYTKFSSSIEEIEKILLDKREYSEKTEDKESGYYITIISDNEITFESDSYGIVANAHYELKTYEEEDIAYLPVEQFICFPKREPGVYRCYSKYFTDFNRAYEYFEKMKIGDKKAPFHDCEKIIIIGSKKEFDEENWYQMNQEVLSMAPFPKNSKTWHPIVWAQLDNLKEELQNGKNMD